MDKNVNNTISFEEDEAALSNIPRDRYEEVFSILSENIWEYGGGLSFEDLKNGCIGVGIKDNDLVNEETEEDIMKLLHKDNKDYSREESEDFIMKVKASNVTDISDSGYFYKKLASCMDNVRIIDEDCGSTGKIFEKSDIFDMEKSQDLFEYKIKDLWVEDFNKMYSDLDDLRKDIKASKLKRIHVRTPIECKHASDRKFCRRCVGNMSSGDRTITSDNVGIITTLAVTEHVTQGSLSSMNEGREENINTILERGFSRGNEKLKKGTFEEYKEVIEKIIDDMGNVGVEARWYEIALIGRVYKSPNDDGMYLSTTFKNSSNYVVDELGCFLFSPSLQHLKNLISDGVSDTHSFDIESCKARNLFDLF